MADTPKSQNITWHGAEITQEQREAAVGQNGCDADASPLPVSSLTSTTDSERVAVKAWICLSLTCSGWKR